MCRQAAGDIRVISATALALPLASHFVSRCDRMAELGIPHLATSRRQGQESKSQCKLATPYLTMYLGLLTAFSVPLRPRPQIRDVIDHGGAVPKRGIRSANAADREALPKWEAG